MLFYLCTTMQGSFSVSIDTLHLIKGSDLGMDFNLQGVSAA